MTQNAGNNKSNVKQYPKTTIDMPILWQAWPHIKDPHVYSTLTPDEAKTEVLYPDIGTTNHVMYNDSFPVNRTTKEHMV